MSAGAMKKLVRILVRWTQAPVSMTSASARPGTPTIARTAGDPRRQCRDERPGRRKWRQLVRQSERRCSPRQQQVKALLGPNLADDHP
jgi:hypothetical protein